MREHLIEWFEIEQDEDEYCLVGHGTYGSSSVLSGGGMFARLDWGSLEEMKAVAKSAKKAGELNGYKVRKNANVSVLDNGSKAMKPDLSGVLRALPGEDDPVPGGMYPDDY